MPSGPFGECVATVLIRAVGRANLGVGTRTTYGVSLPATALVRLGWKEGDRVDVWVDQKRDCITIKRIVVPEAPQP